MKQPPERNPAPRFVVGVGLVAHDFNNLLAIILGYGELLRERLVGDQEGTRAVDEILRAGRRGVDLTRELLAFCGEQAIGARAVDIQEQLEGLDRRFAPLLGSGIRLEVTPAAPGLIVRVDPAHLERVIFNLVLHAQQAMPDGGTIRIEAGEEHLREDARDLVGAFTAGPYVRISVRDEGAGIDPEALSRIFEPSSSTGQEKVTRLGLSTVLGILQQAGGGLRVESEVGRGSVFHALLPRASGPVPSDAVTPSLPADAHASNLRVLLVEDHDSLRRLVAQGLRDRGHHVEEAPTATEARRLLERLDHIDALISDISLPDDNGLELAKSGRSLHERLAVVLVSAYGSAELSLTESGPGTAFLQKPFRPDVLDEVMRRMVMEMRE